MGIKYILTVVGSILFFCNGYGQTTFMTYNIRYDTPKDGENWWEYRRDEVVELLNYYGPDFIGVQEAMPNQTKFIQRNLNQYKYIGFGRDGNHTDSEGTPLFYNKKKYKLLSKETFWLSDTPKKVSKGWDAALNRIAIYGVFLNKKTKDTLHIFNTHFDHIGEIARLKSAELLLEIIAQNQLFDKKLILMGDLNTLPNDEPIKLLKSQLEDGYNKEEYPVYGPTGTFNEFDTDRTLTERIDYIFTRNLSVKSYRCIDDRRSNNLYPSDHLPVLIKL